MLWFFLCLIVVFVWGFTDLFYKAGTDESDPDSFLKIAIWVGIIMGVVSFALLPFSESGQPLWKLVTGNTGAIVSSLCYIASMVVGYAGLRYLELSIISPIQNSSGGVAMVFMLLWFLMTGKIADISEAMGGLDWTGVVLIVGGLVALAIVEQRVNRADALAASGSEAQRMNLKADSPHTDLDAKYRMGIAALLFPLIYCILDAAGTGVTGIILSEELGEIDNQIIYGIFFLAAAVCLEIYLKLRRGSWYNPFQRSEKIRAAAGVTETAANVVYIYAMAMKPVLAAPIISSYCVVSMLLSRLIMKEKLCRAQYVCLGIVVAGILVLGISEGLAS